MFVTLPNKRHHRQAAKLFATPAKKPSSLTLDKPVVLPFLNQTGVRTARRKCDPIQASTDPHLMSMACENAEAVSSRVQAP
ncbi:hypothetical protein [Pseudorhodoferax sp. Leaf265]|uniref:hypothetical protein n=1 Tax=Pseudorhodoferax sp. Leaf265 TaxID=1736315 RepID=UPI0012E71AB0|nr:hypothetical protein [Pseudorhodoferax sp. Leaf265]